MERLTAWKLLDEADCHLTVARYVLMRADEGWQFIAYPQILLNPLHCWFLKLGDKETESPKGGEWVKPHSRLKGLKSCFWRNSEWNPMMESSVNNYRSSLIWKGLARCVAHTMASAVFERIQAIKVKAGESGTFWSGGEIVVMTFHFGSKGRCIA